MPIVAKSLQASLLMFTGQLALIAATSFFAPTVAADPPPWAPAHGYRAKHEHHRGQERQDERDENPTRYPATGYIVNGNCNRTAVGTVLGGVTGGVVGAQIGKGDGKQAATIIGAIIGAVAGGAIGRSMDEADHYCMGQTLEYAEDRKTVSWRNPGDGRNYVVTPTRTYQDEGKICRDYTTQSTLDGEAQKVHGTACRQGDGSWRIVNL